MNLYLLYNNEIKEYVSDMSDLRLDIYEKLLHYNKIW